jgi:hypothetical protein
MKRRAAPIASENRRPRITSSFDSTIRVLHQVDFGNHIQRKARDKKTQGKDRN